MKPFLTFVLFALIALTNNCDLKEDDDRSIDDIHFCLSEGILDAPYELLLINGKYHLYYASADNSSDFKVGYAVTNDLVHWNQNTNVIIDSTVRINNLSLVVDWNNMSGFGNDDQPVLAFYTNHLDSKSRKIQTNQNIYISYSNDNGMTWQKELNNSIVLNDLSEDIEDIKVIWHEEMQQWVMLVLSGYHIRFYNSANLINWEYVSSFGDAVEDKSGDWTTLDFSQVGTDALNNKKWVLFVSTTAGSPNNGSGTQYFVGDFNGFEFSPLTHKPKWVDNGTDNFAGVAFTNYFETEEPSYYLGSIFNSKYEDFNTNEGILESYTITRKLSLINKFNDYYLRSEPAKALDIPDNGKILIKEQDYSGELTLNEKPELPIKLNLTFDVNNRIYLDFAEIYGIEITNNEGTKIIIGYHSLRRYFYITCISPKDDKPEENTIIDYAYYAIDQPVMDMTLFIDQNSVELYAIDGFISMTKKCEALNKIKQIKLFATDGKVKLLNGYQVEL
ncbi:GH32 C-terminal domain-containing protein [Saccharicrinis sp. FJH62]|uniref:GH32 C-terminal domain-containing protein n=1 Tax=Saccharicrinis sp. FJH62 TaxID=3344657 RepID=UPI0035D40530